MLRLVPQGKAPDHPARLRASMGGGVALPVIQAHQPLRTQGHAVRTPVEQVIGRDAFLASRLNFNDTEPVPERFEDGAGGSLASFYRVLAGQHGVGEGAKEPSTVDGLCGLPENDMRGSGDEGDLARLQRIQTYHSHVGVHSAFSNRNTRGQAKLLGCFLAEPANDDPQVQHFLGKLLEKVAQPDSLVQTYRKTAGVAVVEPFGAGRVNARCPFAGEAVSQPIAAPTDMFPAVTQLPFLFFQPLAL